MNQLKVSVFPSCFFLLVQSVVAPTTTHSPSICLSVSRFLNHTCNSPSHILRKIFWRWFDFPFFVSFSLLSSSKQRDRSCQRNRRELFPQRKESLSLFFFFFVFVFISPSQKRLTWFHVYKFAVEENKVSLLLEKRLAEKLHFVSLGCRRKGREACFNDHHSWYDDVWVDVTSIISCLQSFLGSTTERATEKGPRNIFDYFPYLYLSFPVPAREGYRETHQEECSGKNIILFWHSYFSSVPSLGCYHFSFFQVFLPGLDPRYTSWFVAHIHRIKGIITRFLKRSYLLNKKWQR